VQLRPIWRMPGLGGQAGPRFLGTVLNVTNLPRADPSVFLSSHRARLRVDEPFGGLAPDVREVDVYTGSGGGDCGIAFKVGEVYLIDALVGKELRMPGSAVRRAGWSTPVFCCVSFGSSAMASPCRR